MVAATARQRQLTNPENEFGITTKDKGRSLSLLGFVRIARFFWQLSNIVTEFDRRP
jgi:hypothetical protein